MIVCDCKKGYWHQQLEEASSFFTTFNTKLGKLRYKVMPFGATVAGDVFQCKLDQCFGHIKNVIVIAEDIMIVGKRHSHSDHEQVLTTLLETVGRCNVRLNYDKLQYKKNEVNFFGETHTTSSCKPAQSTVSAITVMPAPTLQAGKKQVQSFIGMINYVSKFSVQLSELTEPIRELPKKMYPSTGDPEHQSAFTLMKRRLPALQYLHITTQTDSTPNRCKHKRIGWMLAARWETSLLYKQSFNRSTKRVCGHRVRVISSCVCH